MRMSGKEMNSRFDLIVVGAGPGGYVAAERAGEKGKRVLLIEKAHLGGVCTNVGCIPTKALLNTAKHYLHAKEGAQFGVWAEKTTYDLKQAMAWKQDTIETLRKGIAYLMKSSKVTVVTGEAEWIDDHHVGVNGEVYEGGAILIATGSSSARPPIPGMGLPIVMTSTEILDIGRIPEKLVVIGGGVIGIEFASYFSMIGTSVTVIEMLDEIIPLMEPEFSKLMRRELKGNGVDIKLGCRVEEITETGVRYTDKKGNAAEATADAVLVSVGRTPNIAGLEKLKTAQGFGLDINRRGIAVNDRMQTNIPSVYAAGDVTGKSLLAHSASRMAEVAVENIFPSSSSKSIMRYEAVPWVVYSLPEAAGCGMTEAEAKDSGFEVIASAMQLRANGRFLAEYGKKAAGMCKVIAEKSSGRILGIHLLGGSCSEMIHSAVGYIEAEMRVQDIREMIFPHPTVSEVIKEVCTAIDKERGK